MLLLLAVLSLACRPSDSGSPAADSGGSVLDPDEAPVLTAAAHPTVLAARWAQGTTGEGRLAWAIDGEPAGASPWRAGEPGPRSAWIAGVPYGHTVTAWAETRSEDQVVQGPVATAQLPALPDGLPTPVVTVDHPERQDLDVAWVLISASSSSLSGRWWTLILDRQGRVVWARESDDDTVSMQPQPSFEGDALLIDDNSFWARFDGGAASTVVRTTLDGETPETYRTPGLHHPFTPLPDGALAWGAVDGGHPGDTDEVLVVRDRAGTMTPLWRCQDWQAQVGVLGYCGSNTLRWHPDRGVFLYSFYSSDTVIELDRDGVVQRWFGQAPGSVPFAGREDAPGAASGFWWQHGAYWTTDDTLLLSTRSQAEEAGAWTELRAWEVREEEGSEVLVEVERFGGEAPVHARYMGEAWVLPGGGRLHNLGSGSVLREISPEGEVVWELDWEDGRFIGRSTALGDLTDFLPPGP